MSTSVCVSVCLCVCLRGYLRNHTRDLYCIFVQVAYGRGSVLLQGGDEIQRGRGQFGGFIGKIDSALYKPYSGMNFATKDRIGLNLLIYREVE